MSQSPPSADDSAGAPAPPEAGDFEALRELLLGREKQQLEGLQARVENPALRAQDVGRVLPQAVVLASSRGSNLTAALAPAVEAALRESVRRDPTPLVNAVFPILGPAIRKAVAEALGRLVQSLNQALDHSLSLRSWRWRLEAARTGRSFAEVLLAHTLIYRVEQVFLIHQHTGLLLLHARIPQIQAEDPAMVSGMLTAIQDFARDSFHVSAGETLHTLQVGELNVWVEAGPQLALAAVIRGQAPADYRLTLQTALETIHRDQAAPLEAFDGDAAPFELARPHLESCFQAQFAGASQKRSSARLAVGLALVAALLAAWAYGAAQKRRHWLAYVDWLRAQPGIVVIETGKRSGKFFVAGLRDPLAVEPAESLSQFQLEPGSVTARWEPYHALGAPLALQRATLLLEPPPDVTLRVQDGVLFAKGAAPASWADAARLRAPLLPGIHAFDSTALDISGPDRVAELKDAIERTTIFFDDGAHLASGQESALDALVSQLAGLRAAVEGSGRRTRIAVVGHTDQTGTEEYNLRLSRQRGEHVANLLRARGVPATWLAPEGAGASGPSRSDGNGGEQPLERRVTLRVVVDRPPPNTPAP